MLALASMRQQDRISVKIIGEGDFSDQLSSDRHRSLLRQDREQIFVRPGNHMNTDQFSRAAGCHRPGLANWFASRHVGSRYGARYS